MDHNSVHIIPNLINKLVHKTTDKDSFSAHSSPRSVQEVSETSDGSLNETHSGDGNNYGNFVGRSGLSIESRDALFVPQKFDFAPAFTCMNPPYNDPTFAGFLAPCGSSSLIHSQMMSAGLPPRVPLLLDPMEEPVFVNPKQYNAILRRRQARAKLEAQNKIVTGRKPYLHESRHRHAMKRARGSGGRFLNTKQQNTQPPAKQSDDVTKTNLFHEVTSSGNPTGYDTTTVSTHARKPNQQENIHFAPKDIGPDWGNGSHYRARVMVHDSGVMGMGHGSMLFGNSSLAL